MPLAFASVKANETDSPNPSASVFAHVAVFLLRALHIAGKEAGSPKLEEELAHTATPITMLGLAFSFSLCT